MTMNTHLDEQPFYNALALLIFDFSHDAMFEVSAMQSDFLTFVAHEYFEARNAGLFKRSREASQSLTWAELMRGLEAPATFGRSKNALFDVAEPENPNDFQLNGKLLKNAHGLATAFREKELTPLLRIFTLGTYETENQLEISYATALNADEYGEGLVPQQVLALFELADRLESGNFTSTAEVGNTLRTIFPICDRPEKYDPRVVIAAKWAKSQVDHLKSDPKADSSSVVREFLNRFMPNPSA